MEALIKDIFTFLIQHYALYLVIVMSITTALIVLVLNLIKKPIKKLTIKIGNERARKFVNRLVIFILSFGLSFGVWFLLNWISPSHFQIDYLIIVFNGAIPIVTYAFAEGWITAPKAKEIVNNLKEVADDGKITKEEVKDTVKDLNTALDAEQTLQELLKK